MIKKDAQIAPNVFEFIFEQADLEEGLRVIRGQVDGKCLINTEPMGNRVKVTAILFSDVPEGKADDIMAGLKESHIEVHSFQAGNAEREVDF